MLLAEYDYDTDIAVQRKEAFDDGIAIGEKLGEERGISIGLSQGAREAKIETAKNLLSIGLPQEQIALVTGLSPEEIEKL
jgi:predicted transposase/invertase (TIGR01784 family)